MLLSFRILACAFLCHVFASACWAWADAGHKTIALIAWAQLSPETRAAVVSLLERHPTFSKQFAEQMKAELGETPSKEARQRWIFAQAAVWPDMVRPPLDGSPNKYAKYHHASWHYLDLPVFADAKSQAELTDKMPKLYWNWKPGMPEFIEQKLTAAQALDKALHVVPDVQHQMDSDRVLMLCWMFHVTGDLHQPCHCSSLFALKPFPKGDRGGNSILVKDPVVDNLHSFWDQLLGYKLSATDAQTLAESLLKDTALVEKAKRASAVLEPKAWIEEGSALAKTHVYTPALLSDVLKLEPHTYKKNNISYEAVGPLTLTAEPWKEYTTQAQALARQQAVTAGFRLAKLLEAAVAPAL